MTTPAAGSLSSPAPISPSTRSTELSLGPERRDRPRAAVNICIQLRRHVTAVARGKSSPTVPVQHRGRNRGPPRDGGTMPANFLHGIEITEVTSGPLPVTVVKSASSNWSVPPLSGRQRRTPATATAPSIRRRWSPLRSGNLGPTLVSSSVDAARFGSLRSVHGYYDSVRDRAPSRSRAPVR